MRPLRPVPENAAVLESGRHAGEAVSTITGGKPTFRRIRYSALKMIFKQLPSKGGAIGAPRFDAAHPAVALRALLDGEWLSCRIAAKQPITGRLAGSDDRRG
jgi:hypothetical protein